MDAQEVIILIHENVLDEMLRREARMIREMRRMAQELEQLRAEIDNKKAAVKLARDKYLMRCV